MKRSWLIALGGLLLAVLCGIFIFKARHVPAGQPGVDRDEPSGPGRTPVRFQSQRASAIETILEHQPKSSVEVFAVWEPILLTDWSAPGTSALTRLSDRRVQQFSDPNHLMAALLKKAEGLGTIHPNCCERNGFLWDLTAAYSPGKLWGDTPPEPILLHGPVVKNTAELESVMAPVK